MIKAIVAGVILAGVMASGAERTVSEETFKFGSNRIDIPPRSERPSRAITTVVLRTAFWIRSTHAALLCRTANRGRSCIPLTTSKSRTR